jgi:hypothetical protein
MRALLLLSVLALPGCAAVFKGSVQDVRIESDPAGVVVERDGQMLGRTPTVAPFNRNDSVHMKFSAPGYEEAYGSLRTHPDGAWWFADVATCVIPIMLCIPLLADAITGSWMELEPEVFRVHMKPLPTAPTAPVPASPTAGSAPNQPLIKENPL